MRQLAGRPLTLPFRLEAGDAVEFRVSVAGYRSGRLRLAGVGLVRQAAPHAWRRGLSRLSRSLARIGTDTREASSPRRQSDFAAALPRSSRS
ncbi:MAG: hypothetical protein ACLP1D_19195 [Xanthobacteraceae bacterium]